MSVSGAYAMPSNCESSPQSPTNLFSGSLKGRSAGGQDAMSGCGGQAHSRLANVATRAHLPCIQIERNWESCVPT